LVCVTCTSPIRLVFPYLDTLKLSKGTPLSCSPFCDTNAIPYHPHVQLFVVCTNARLPTNRAVWFDVTKGRSYEHGHEARAAASRAEPADLAISMQGLVSRRYLAVALFCVAEPLSKEWRYDWYSEILRAGLDCVGRIKEDLERGPTYFTAKLRAEFMFVLLLHRGSCTVRSL